MRIPTSDLKVGRVTHEDDDFITLEIAKHDQVKWTVEPLPGEENQRFFTIMFVHKSDSDDGIEIWTPWEQT